jgi:PE family
LLLAHFGPIAGRQAFDTQLRRDLQVIDEDLHRRDTGGHMSFVTTQPGLMTEAAGNLTGIGSAMNAENSAAAAPTTGVVPAAADEVSALTAAQFAVHAQMYQAISAQAAAIHEIFVNTLGTSAGSYAATEAANAVAAT